jgi:mRNA-degrading endonuclease RelE of RelBE toxin-antitoxin system
MFELELSRDALEDLKSLRKSDRTLILDSLEKSLTHEPTQETRQKKLLRPNPLSNWELRVGQFRVFYDVDLETQVVLIKAVGWKDHNTLLIRGKEFQL